MTGDGTKLSIIVASVPPDREACAWVADVARRGRTQGIEVIRVERADVAQGGLIERDAAGVLHLSLPEAATLPRLLGAAIAQARGEILAITDTTCAVDETWVSSVLTAHEAPHPVIGGAVEPGELRTVVDWAAYFAEYGQFMLPLAEGVVRELPGNNFSMKRWVLAQGREFVEGEFWKTYWCRRLQAMGLPLHATPSIVLRHRKSFELWPFLARRFHHGRCFAGMRTREDSGVGRLIHVVGSPVLPGLLMGRILRAVLPKRRYRRELILALPVIWLATLTWALGELVGYIRGPGGSCRHVQ